jgi:hypothetical protein
MAALLEVTPQQEQLEKALGASACFFLQQAELRGYPQGAQEYRNTAYSQALVFYRVDVVGPGGSAGATGGRARRAGGVPR